MGTAEITIRLEYAPDFLKAAKALARRYRSFSKDLEKFLNDLKKNPKAGDDLGCGIRKIRMAIESKGKGKRGGARVITFNVIVDEQDLKITLLYIYDKSDLESISKSKIKQMLIDNDIKLENN